MEAAEETDQNGWGDRPQEVRNGAMQARRREVREMLRLGSLTRSTAVGLRADLLEDRPVGVVEGYRYRTWRLRTAGCAKTPPV